MMTNIFHFMLSLSCTVTSFVYKDKWWFDESMTVTLFMETIEKRIILFPLHTNSSLN